MKAILGVIFVAAAVGGCGRGGDAAQPARIDGEEALAILESTPWLDRMPERETDVFHSYVFGGGEGVYLASSAHKGEFEVFRYVAEEDRLRVRFLAEGKEYDTRFRIEHVDHGYFGWRLTLSGAPRGPETYYGFKHEHDVDRLPRALRGAIGAVR